jgi:ribose 5-phosphate isomerase B
MRVHLGTDHAGLELKDRLSTWLAEHGYEPVDHGAHEYDADDDYPPFCVAAAQAAVDEPGSLAIVIGGSGNGEQMAANKVRGARAALAWSTETAALAREHNDAQVVAIGGRMHSFEEAVQIVETFLTTPFSGAERHQRRIDLLATYESTGRFD